MKLRHVRAVAVFGVALVLLTGARGSHGGSCGKSDSDSSSSSSSSGGSDDAIGTTGSTGDVGKDDLSGGTSSTGTTSSGTSTTGSVGGSRNDAMRDIRISDCSYDEATGITASLSATNSTSETVTYEVTVKFTDANSATIATEDRTMALVEAGGTDTLDVSTPYVPEQGSNGGGECKVTDVYRKTY